MFFSFFALGYRCNLENHLQNHTVQNAVYLQKCAEGRERACHAFRNCTLQNGLSIGHISFLSEPQCVRNAILLILSQPKSNSELPSHQPEWSLIWPLCCCFLWRLNLFPGTLQGGSCESLFWRSRRPPALP